jgi:DNA-3-methyladenine glycosylase II
MPLPRQVPVSRMVSTRSASGLSAASNAKRKAVSDSSPPKSKQKKVRVAAELPSMTGPPNTVALHNGTDTTPLVPATLSFDFEEARQHLINADPRFEDIFATMQCKPFEQLEQVHPFRCVIDIFSASEA